MVGKLMDKFHPAVADTARHRLLLVCSVAMLTLIGLLMIYTASGIAAFQWTSQDLYFVRKQAAAALLGFALIFAVGHVPFIWIKRLCLPITALALLLLILAQIPGLQVKAKGAARWIYFFGFTIQPAEFVKLAFILFMAKNLSRPKSNPADFMRGVLPNILICAVFCGLLLLQPDFGTCALLLVLCFMMLFVAGLPFKTTLIGCVLVVLAAAAVIIAAPYRLARLTTFMDPWQSWQGSGFQIIQSFLAFQNGGLAGQGLGESRQKLFFLPEAHTDFILSVIGEELGLLGVLLVCTLFVFVCSVGFLIAMNQKDSFKKFAAFGITCWIALQALINMGVSMGSLPTKGMTLPFVSNGTNSLVVFLVAVAILGRISQETIASQRSGKLESRVT